MRSPASLLVHRTAASLGNSPSPLQPPASVAQRTAAPGAMAVDSDMVVILASLLCALVCVLGLALVSRCACRRRRSASNSPDHCPPPKGLKKKAIDALPTISFAASPESSPPAPTVWSSSSSECAICLAQFKDGESIRVLPQCGHGFHVVCVDAWLQNHASCPSCRAAIGAVEPLKPAPATPTVVVVVVAGEGSRCGRCGELAAPSGACAGGGNADPVYGLDMSWLGQGSVRATF